MNNFFEKLKNKPDFEPIRLLLLGTSGSGKTTLLKRILYNELSGKFNYIYLICPSYMSQDIWKNTKITNKYDTADNKTFEIVMNEVKENRENNKESCIILDDWIGFELSKQKSSLSKWIPQLRHYWCSIIILSQYYKSVIPPVVRMQLSHFICFHCPFNGEVKKIHEEFGDQWKKNYDNYTKIPYGYVYSDLTKNELLDRYDNKIKFT